MESTKLKEYETLRTEILQKVELHNTLLTFTITTTLASLTFALSSNSMGLYLIPFCILITMSPRIGYYRSAMAKMAAYILVFIENGEPEDGLRWETRNNEVLTEKPIKTKKNAGPKVKMFLSNYECLILSIVCYGCFAVKFFENGLKNFLNVMLGISPILFVVLIFFITRRTSVDKSKKIWISKWRKLQEESNKRDQV